MHEKMNAEHHSTDVRPFFEAKSTFLLGADALLWAAAAYVHSHNMSSL